MNASVTYCALRSCPLFGRATTRVLVCPEIISAALLRGKSRHGADCARTLFQSTVPAPFSLAIVEADTHQLATNALFHPMRLHPMCRRHRSRNGVRS